MVYLPSTTQGQVLCWAPNVGWLKVLIATLGGKEAEAQRGEVTWPRSRSEEAPGPASYLLSFRCCQAILGFRPDPREQCVNDLNRKLNGSLKKKKKQNKTKANDLFALFTSHFKRQQHSPQPERYLYRVSKNVFICRL